MTEVPVTPLTFIINPDSLRNASFALTLESDDFKWIASFIFIRLFSSPEKGLMSSQKRVMTRRTCKKTSYSSSCSSSSSSSNDIVIKTAPDGGWGWMVVFASFMIHLIADGVTYTFGIFYFELLKYFASGKGLTAWIPSIMTGMTFAIGQ